MNAEQDLLGPVAGFHDSWPWTSGQRKKCVTLFKRLAKDYMKKQTKT